VRPPLGDPFNPALSHATMSNPPHCKTQVRKRHVLADLGINLTHQRAIAVERFAVLDFRRSLPNARLQSGGLDIVLQALQGGLPEGLSPFNDGSLRPTSPQYASEQGQIKSFKKWIRIGPLFVLLGGTIYIDSAKGGRTSTSPIHDVLPRSTNTTQLGKIVSYTLSASHQ
jgi:hypothetical protein